MTQSLDFKKMGLMPMNEAEMLEVEGGGLWSFIKDYAIGKAVDFLVDNMVADWKSRTGGPASLTDRYAAHGPY